MALNKIYEFAQDSLNILNDADYLADPTLEDGILAGSKARSELHNKIFKQATLCAAGLSQFTAENQDEDIEDSLTVEEYADALTAAIDSRVTMGIGSNIVTQPQFDNQELAATDEFVNRALGSYSNARDIDQSVTALDASDVGKIINFKPSIETSTTLSLPDYTDPVNFRLGSVIEINCAFYSGITFLTVTPAAGQNLLASSGYDISEITLGYGDNAKFAFIERDGTKYWQLVGGTVSFQEARTFSYSANANGSALLPGGIKMVWGTATFPTTNTGATSVHVNFSSSFTTACFGIYGNGNAFVSASSTFSPVLTFQDITTTGFTACASSNSIQEDNDAFTHDVGFKWFAIGY